MGPSISDQACGIYIHIPFCGARCGYCDFVTFTGKEDKIESYVQELGKEIALHGREAWGTRSMSTVFFGGGTPSLLEPRQVSGILGRLRQTFPWKPDPEITLEANPESLTRAKAEGWRGAGVNRLSIGLQAMDDRLLKSLDRLHDVKGFLDAYHAARAAGFENVSVDLIYGLPSQTLEDWQDTLRRTLELEPDHISMYALAVEEHTPFNASGVQTDADLQAEMFEWSRPVLKQAGFEHYEISNFSRPGKECRHNLLYWRQEDYLGLGAGAVGCLGALRWQNDKTLQGYSKSVKEEKFPWVKREELSPETRKFERLMLGLRLREGYLWPVEENEGWRNERLRLSNRGLLEEIQPGRWRIPDAAVGLTNQVLLPFLP